MADVVVNSESHNPKELYSQGVRAYVLQDYSAAVSALSQAIEMLVTEHKDDLHESLGDVYLFYGKSLLGVSRDESEALGDAVPRNIDSSGEEDEEGAEDNNEENENADNEAKETKPDEEDKKEDAAEEQQEPVASSSNGTSKWNTEEPSSSNGVTAAETEEEPTDLQVAWEVLELAKKIFQKKGESARKNLAETLTVLGEVSLESENFEAAISDINDGLKIQKELYAKDSRTVAESYYKLGIAYSTNSQIDDAINSFNNSVEYLKNRVSNLEKLEDKKDDVQDEIKEIKNLIPDIQEKITDMKTYKDETLKKIVTAVTEGTKAETPTPSTSSSKPASDISHLVKRKRKVDETEDNQKKEAELNPAKKANVD